MLSARLAAILGMAFRGRGMGIAQLWVGQDQRIHVVPEEGVEPTRPCGQRILSPPRLPFRHSGVLRARLSY